MFGFDFSYDRSDWAKGNFLICCIFLQNIKLREEISPPLIKFAADQRYMPNPGGEVKLLETTYGKTVQRKAELRDRKKLQIHGAKLFIFPAPQFFQEFFKREDDDFSHFSAARFEAGTKVSL